MKVGPTQIATFLPIQSVGWEEAKECVLSMNGWKRSDWILGWVLPPLPLTDGGAKTKQPSRLRGFRPYHGEASPHPLLLPQCGPGLIQGLAWLEQKKGRGRKQCRRRMMSHGEVRGSKGLWLKNNPSRTMGQVPPLSAGKGTNAQIVRKESSAKADQGKSWLQLGWKWQSGIPQCHTQNSELSMFLFTLPLLPPGYYDIVFLGSSWNILYSAHPQRRLKLKN